ncbi:MAG: C4-dicarboxylate ABC transporter [Gammaproteobacteria bacterium]|nr:C4-dicarboxylate ABC transporter [Gammaproteobacteria bacterium]
MHTFRFRATFALLLGFWSGVCGAQVLKIGALSPEGSVWMDLLREGGARVAAETEGRVSFKFYPGGVMGDDKAVLRKIRIGQLHGAVVTAGALVQTYPDIALYNLPMAFRSGEEVDYVRERLDAELLAGLEAKGFVALGLAEVGFAYAMTQQPVSSVADVRMRKVWVPDNDPGSARALQAFGVAPIPLPIVDVLGGLQTGLIDCVAAPPVGAVALQWHTRVSHVLDVPLIYVYGLFALDKRRLERLAAADQAVVRRVMGEVVGQVNARSRRDHEQASAALANQGLEWRSASDGEMAEWHRLAEQATLRLVEEEYVSAGLYHALQGHLRDFRAGLLNASPD